MKRSRLSILGLMAIIVLIALAFAALRNPTILWSSLIFTATVAFLATAALGAIARRGRARMTWAGVAVFGWAYLAMSFGPFPNGNGVDCPPFLTQIVLDAARSSQEADDAAKVKNPGRMRAITSDGEPRGERITEDPPMVSQSVAPGTPGALISPGVPGEGLPIQPNSPPIPGGLSPVIFVPYKGPSFNWKNHRRIGHSIGAILFGLVGALVGRALAGRDEPNRETRTTPA